MSGVSTNMEAKTIPCRAPAQISQSIDTESLIYRTAALLQYEATNSVRNRLLDEGIGRDTTFFVINAATILNSDIESYLSLAD